MAEYIGRNIVAGIAKEAVRGTAEAAPDFWLRITSQDHKDQAEYLQSQGSIGTIVENVHAEIDKQWGEGGFSAEIEVDSIGLVLLAALGDVATTEPQTDVFLHKFSLEESANHQSLSYFVNEPGRASVYPLACVSTLSFNFERGKILDFSTNLMSKAGVAQASSPAFTPLQGFRPKDFHFYLADDIAGLDMASETFLKTFSLEINKNLEADDVLGLESPQNFLNKVFALSASLNLFYKDETYRTIFRAGTPKAMRVKLENPTLELEAAIAATQTIEILDYTGLTGGNVVVGGTTLTEGVAWASATSNNQTASNLAAAINNLASVNAQAVGAVVTITAATPGAAGNAITVTSNGGADIDVNGATLAGGVDAVRPSLTFDFARVYFAEYDEDNARDNVKGQEINLSFAVNNEEMDIPFAEIRLVNAHETY